MSRRRAGWATAVLLLGLGTLAACGGAPAPSGARAAPEASRGGAEFLLRGVDMREVHPGGETYRFRSEQASYSIEGKRLSASGVTVLLPGRSGEETVVRAPQASWDTGAGRITLPEGGSAEGGGGWSAAVRKGIIDIKGRIFRGRDARLLGPGLAVAGDNLVWLWEEGRISLSDPRTRISPSSLLGKGE